MPRTHNASSHAKRKTPNSTARCTVCHARRDKSELDNLGRCEEHTNPDMLEDVAELISDIEYYHLLSHLPVGEHGES